MFVRKKKVFKIVDECIKDTERFIKLAKTEEEKLALENEKQGMLILKEDLKFEL